MVISQTSNGMYKATYKHLCATGKTRIVAMQALIRAFELQTKRPE